MTRPGHSRRTVDVRFRIATHSSTYAERHGRRLGVHRCHLERRRAQMPTRAQSPAKAIKSGPACRYKSKNGARSSSPSAADLEEGARHAILATISHSIWGMFSPEVHALVDPEQTIRASMHFIAERLSELAA